MEKESERKAVTEMDEADFAREGEQSPELLAWFKEHPTEADALKLTLEEKKEFILKYYSEDCNSEELLEKMVEEAEKILDDQIKLGHDKPPYSELLVLALIAISKAKIIDELIEDVSKMYEERRKLIKGKDIKDKGVVKVTQLNCEKMGMMLQGKIVKQVEQEATGRNFDLNVFMEIASAYVISDLGSFVELERLYNFRRTEANKDKEIDRPKVRQYIEESLVISKRILSGDLDNGSVFMFPHLLSDQLFNLTGFESEEVVYYIRKMTKDGSIDPELVDLIIQEAYSVEQSKDVCFSTFDNQMRLMDQMYQEQYMQQMQHFQSIKDPLEDPSIKKMIEMGMISREQAQELVQNSPKGFPPGMMPPGMMPPGMFPPGMMPPGMMPPGMMPPGMFPPGMMPPGMMPQGPPPKPK